MAAYEGLLNHILSIVRANFNEEITGTNLQQVLVDMVSGLGALQFRGLATKTTDPNGPIAGQAIYIATEVGTYTNFGLAITQPGVYLFTWNVDTFDWDISQIVIPYTHNRLHSIDSTDDHNIIPVENRLKLVFIDADGKIAFLLPADIEISQLWERDGVNEFLYPTNINDSVGVKTFAPTRDLDINGNLRIRTLGNGDDYTKILVADANGNIDVIDKIDLVGADGLTPFIGLNGNWWIGTTDTGIQATGPQGPQGETGATGPQGLQGETGAVGADGASTFVYIAYASDDQGADFSLNFSAATQNPRTYIAVLTTDTEIASPSASDFAGLWMKFIGEDGGLYRHTQSTPDVVWNITHNLGRFPSVTITDTSGNEVEGEVVHNDFNSLTLTFSAPFAGFADLN